MTATAPRHTAVTTSAESTEALRAAFRELHGPRLHGFALLLTLGDRPRSAALASEALASGAERVDELRHPERAAAWLRRHVVDGARAASRHDGDGRVLFELGADASFVAALGRLKRKERAALIASTIERLDQRDVGTVVGRDGASLDRLVRRARSRYVDAYAVAAPEDGLPGPIVTRIHELARAALA